MQVPLVVVLYDKGENFYFRRYESMKKFTRLTAIIISLTMILASMYTGVYAADLTFTDVESTNQYSAAIYSLVSKGIINGYTEADGTSTFKPDNTITRAEFAKLLVLATTPGVVHSTTTDKFPDLSVDHWANPYIAAAVSTGAINGYEDGTFRPEAPVSYGEAIKMIVCTLGYGNVITPTEPWYDGYIRMANSIKLTKGAVGLGANEAKRGLVAQLIYNINDVKPLVQTGTDAFGNAHFGTDTSKEDYEDYYGVVTGVFEDTLEGLGAYGLKKNQVRIDDEVFYMGNFDAEDFLPYLGRSIEIEYEDGSKKTIVDFEEDSDKTLVLTEVDIDTVDGDKREIIYYDERDREEELELSEDLYVIYNGRGVDQDDIDEDFIEEYFDIDCGQIELINNDGKSDYEVAFITNYVNMFVSNKTNPDDDEYKIYDSYGPVNDITLDDADCTVYKVTTEGGKKSKVDSLSAISSNNVISIASPIDDTEGTEVIISTVALKSKSVESISKGKYIIDDEEYELSSYYEDLIENDSSYELEKGDTGTFYLDFRGRIAYFTKADSTEPYGYLATIDTSSGFDSEVLAYIFTQSGSWLEEYPLADRIKVNGKRCDPEEAVEILQDTAALINDDKTAAMTENADVAQLIKYKLSGKEITEIYTIDPDGDFEDGTIVPGEFVADEDDDKGPFTKGDKKLKYNSSSRVFKDADGSNQFIVNSSTIVLYIPYDRESDLKDYKKRTYSSFTDGSSYLVEPYDMESKTAKVVLVYTTSGASDATIYANAKPIFVEYIGTKKNKEGEYADYIKYYTAGSDDLSEIFVNEDVSLSGINPGDVIRVAQDNGEITGIQRLFVDGELYDYDAANVFDTEIAEDYIITHSYNGDADYYEVVHGKAHSKTKEGDSVSIAPLESDDWEAYTVNSSTVYYGWDSREEEFDVSLTLDDIVTIEKTDEDAATELVAIKVGSRVIAVFVLD